MSTDATPGTKIDLPTRLRAYASGRADNWTEVSDGMRKAADEIERLGNATQSFDMQNTKNQAADRFDAMTPEQIKTFENRMRRMAKRQRLVLLKSRRRDHRAYDFGGYMIVDSQDPSRIVAGDANYEYSMNIAEVETFLTGDKRQRHRSSLGRQH
jgi:hypothetical protein